MKLLAYNSTTEVPCKRLPRRLKKCLKRAIERWGRVWMELPPNGRVVEVVL